MLTLDVSRFDGQASAKRLILLGLLTVILTSVFWTSSRYPQLDQKAMMGGRSAISSLAFDPVMVPTADDGVVMRVVKATVNWYNTNIKGMTFGLLLAGTFLSMLVLVSFTSSRSVFLNTLAGMFLGAPLGVCANCVAPIAKSLDDGGTRIETTLATQFSSPTLNIIVVTMLFTLYPLPVALLKMALTLFLILAAVPVMARYLFVKENESNPVGAVACELAGMPLQESWWQAARGAAVVWLRCFWFIILTAVPFMLLAGFLGALAIELIPAHTLSSLNFTWWGALGLAAFGTFLPVPIAFDVILPSILMTAGLHLGYVMILLFTLGPFSIYPFLLFWKSISPRVVITAYATVMVLGIVGGSMVHAYNLLERSQITGGLVQEDVSPIILQTCADDPRGQDVCADESWYRAASMLPFLGDAACNAIGDADRREVCGDAIRGRILLRDSPTRAASIDRCLGAPDSEGRRDCLLIVARSIITYLRHSGVDGREPIAAQDLTYADLAFSTCEDEACNDPHALVRAHYFQDPRICGDIRDPDLEPHCLSSVAMVAAKRSRDVTRCTDEAVDDRALCVASIDGPSASERLEACVTLGGEETARCEELVLQSPTVLDDPGACDGMEAPGAAQRCRIAREQRRLWEIEAQPHILERIARRVLFGREGGRFDPAEVMAAFASTGTPAYSDEPSLPLTSTEVLDRTDVAVRFTPFAPPSDPADPAAGETVFRRVWTEEIGIPTPRAFLQYDGTTAAADYDGDGWIDIVQSDDSGLHLYRNLGRMRFAPAPLRYDPGYVFPYGVVGFVDVDNDGDLDLFQAWSFSFIFILNDGGSFANARVVPFDGLPGDNLIGAPFADLNHDGLLDLLLAFSEEYTPNTLWMNQGGARFTRSDWYVDQLRGRSYGAVFTDINRDGYTDLFIGNDFEKSDEVLLGTPEGVMRRVGASSGLIEGVSTFNMGYETADINNDLRLDVFSTEALMVEGVVPEDECGDPTWDADFRDACLEFNETYRNAVRGGDIGRCGLLRDPSWRSDCAFRKIARVARATRDPGLCDILPAEPRYLRLGCVERSAPKPMTSHAAHFEDDLPQFHRNALHVQRADGGFDELSEEMGVAESYWAWNSRIHDYDNDGWQDIYVVNGRETDLQDFASDITPSVFFKNLQGKGFEDRAEEYGLADLLQARTYAAEDFDLDGDIDILAQAVRAPYRMYVNGTAGEPDRNAVEIRLMDQRMNRFGIGAQVVVHTADGAQLREIKSNGGFRSHNDPRAHFGLGAADTVTRIEVFWSDGTRTTLDGPFAAGGVYTITRKAAGGEALASR